VTPEPEQNAQDVADHRRQGNLWQGSLFTSLVSWSLLIVSFHSQPQLLVATHADLQVREVGK
ncbi:hypothetical protein, partial [Salmonella enterica]|uniref:hypothetical protein n=1 Tax=Salmonella enterica TaxID=28901 RepID=UPI0020C4FC58